MSTHPGPRRLPPDARRRQITDAARQLINERGSTTISTADVAQAANVTRALVHHYFGGIHELLDAVIQHLAASVAAASLGAGTDIPVQQRVPHNVAALLDVIEANRGVWLAAATGTGPAAATGPATASTGPGGAGTGTGPARLREAILDRILANNTDLIADTPWARLCLTGYIAFGEAVARRWLLGEASRADAQRALTATLLHLLLETIPDR
jgi:AcrR family transcriptional regulator